MKIILLLGSLLASGSYCYFMGHADGYQSGLHDAAPAPMSHCYVPGEAHSADMPPCVRIENPTRASQSKEQL